MLDEDEIKDQVKELEVKLEALELELSQSLEEVDELREVVENPAGEGFTDVQHGVVNFQVHWIRPEETDSFSNCEDIDNIEKARIAFKEAAIKRDTLNHLRPVNQGDILFLMCDTAPEPEPDPNDPTAEPPDTPACSFIGMCVKVDFRSQLKNPDPSLNLTQVQEADGDTYREFFAWDSCGGSSTTNVECDKTEQYIDIITDTKVEYEPTGQNPKIHTIEFYHKTRQLRFDECGTLDFVGTESDWVQVGDTIEINECCDDPPPSHCNPPLSHSSLALRIVNDATNATEVDTTLNNDGTQCRYFDSTYVIQWNTTLNQWRLTGGNFTGQNPTEKGTYTGTAGFTITVS